MGNVISRIELVALGPDARSTPISVREHQYRPQFFIDNRSWSTSYLIDKLVDREELGPGETGVVEGELLRPEMFPTLSVGDQFKLAEGKRMVAKGTVLAIEPTSRG